MFWIISAVLLAAILFMLHYGYKLAFYYTDPQASPYAYTDDDQTRSCKAVLDAAAQSKITFHTVSGAGHALNYVTNPEEYTRVLRNFTQKHL